MRLEAEQRQRRATERTQSMVGGGASRVASPAPVLAAETVVEVVEPVAIAPAAVVEDMPSGSVGAAEVSASN